jgi:hypothetical protein
VEELPDTGFGGDPVQNARLSFLMLLALIGVGVTIHTLRQSTTRKEQVVIVPERPRK